MYFLRSLLFGFFRLLFNRTMLILFGLLALCVFVWYAGPLFSFAEMRPLAPVRARVITIAVIAGLFLLWMLVRFWRRRNINGRLIDRISKIRDQHTASGQTEVGAEELAALQHQFSDAMVGLKQLRISQGRLGRMSGRYLYELPWYMVIGAAGAGKTSALVNSGLNFPLEEKVGKAAIKGVGGTRNCDWWITDDAVLLDTAGRYTTQDSRSDIDKSEWQGFLRLLKKYRPRQPINGVILTMSVSDLLTFSREERDAYYSALRARLTELQNSFGIGLPVYLWVTKADLLKGFAEFFSGYTSAQREQVWGFTFDYNAAESEDVGAEFTNQWSALLQRLFVLQDARFAEEKPSDRLGSAYGLPQQLASLRSVLLEAVETLFQKSKQLTKPMLRGVYLTSATQTGTPFDLILSSLGREFSGNSNVVQHLPSGKERTYFLHDLFAQLIFREPHLAGRNRHLEARKKGLTIVGYAVSVIALVGALTAWAVSYRNNSRYLGHVAAQTTQLSSALKEYAKQPNGDFVNMLGLLYTTETLGDTADFTRDNPQLEYRFGLYQGDKVAAAAGLAHAQLLKAGLLPLVARRLDAQLQQPPEGGLEYLYDVLKSYLMLHSPDHYDARFLRDFVGTDARRFLMPDADEANLALLDSQLAALFSTEHIVASPYPVDEPLVEQVRSKLANLTPAQRIYARLRSKLEKDQSLPGFDLLDVSGPQAARLFVRRSGLPLNRGVPALFTYDGYWDLFDKQVGSAVRSFSEGDAFVMGEVDKTHATQAKELASGKLEREVRMAYLREYVEKWEHYLSDIELIPSDTLQNSIQQLRILTAPDSPLPLFLRGVVKQTTLLRERYRDNGRSMLDRVTNKLRNTRNDIQRAVGPLADKLGSGRRLEQIVDDRFQSLRYLVGPPGHQGPAPLKDSLRTLDEYYTTLVATEDALRSGDAPARNDTAAHVQATAMRLPQPVRGMFDQIAQSSNAQAMRMVKHSLVSDYRAEIGGFCTKAILGRYPMQKNGTDEVTREDFGRMFGEGGLMDRFFRKNLAGVVNTSTWRFKDNGVGRSASARRMLANFRRAEVIREVYFGNAQSEPAVELRIKPVEMDPAITSMSFDVDGTVIHYRHGPQLSTTVRWPGSRGHNKVVLEITGPKIGDMQMEADGAWALARFFDKTTIRAGGASNQFLAAAVIDGKKIVFEVSTSSIYNPFRLPQLEKFSCPGNYR